MIVKSPSRFTILACICIAATVCVKAAEKSDALLNRIQAKMAAYVNELPNYTCHEVVDRFSRPLNSSQLIHFDTVQLEVAFVGKRELFARTATMRFEERSISDIVSQGTIGNGAFGTHAAEVFTGNVATFEFAGEAKKDGHKTYRFNYLVPQEKSHFLVNHQPAAGIVGYKGSFWVDSETLDLIRLELKAEQIPRYIGVSRIEEVMRYKPVKIRDSEFSLPYKSELTAFETTGSYFLNTVSLERCKEFTGESVISFEKPEAAPAPSADRTAPEK